MQAHSDTRSDRPTTRRVPSLAADETFDQLRERVEAAGASCVVVPMPAALARIGESAPIQRGWNPGAALALGLRLGATAVSLPAYEALLGRAVSAFHADVIHTNGLKAHVLAARLRQPRARASSRNWATASAPRSSRSRATASEPSRPHRTAR